MQTTFQRATLAQVPITLVGAGSNLLISDDGIRGLVMCTRRVRKTEFDDAKGQITVAAGEPLPTVAWKVAKARLARVRVGPQAFRVPSAGRW